MTAKHKKEFIALYSENHIVVDRIIELLEKRLAKRIEEVEAVEMYDSPNYLLKISDNAGHRRALREIINLIKPSDKSS